MLNRDGKGPRSGSQVPNLTAPDRCTIKEEKWEGKMFYRTFDKEDPNYIDIEEQTP